MNKNIQFETDKYLKSLVKQSIIYTIKITEQQQQQLFAEEVMDFEFQKYKCRILLRLVGTVEGFHWFRFTEIHRIKKNRLPIGHFELLLWIQIF